jgi:hypothetical protein
VQNVGAANAGQQLHEIKNESNQGSDVLNSQRGGQACVDWQKLNCDARLVREDAK